MYKVVVAVSFPARGIPFELKPPSDTKSFFTVKETVETLLLTVKGKSNPVASTTSAI